MCGSLALELESVKTQAEDAVSLQERIKQLLPNLEKELKRARQLFIEIAELIKIKLNCYQEVEHFFKVIEPALSFLENRAVELKNNIKDSNSRLSKREIIASLYVIEEKSLTCALSLKELKDALIKSGKYKPADSKTKEEIK
jgi:vacuolar-type H+-ATPase subunit I/STV1